MFASDQPYKLFSCKVQSPNVRMMNDNNKERLWYEMNCNNQVKERLMFSCTISLELGDS